MKAPNSILQNHLIDNGVFTEPAVVTDWSLYLGHLPEDTDSSNIAAVYNIDPQKDGRDMNDGAVAQHYGCNLRVRADDYEAGWNKMTDAEVLFSQTVNEVVSLGVSENYKIHAITVESGIISLGADERRRNYFEMRLLVSLSTEI